MSAPALPETTWHRHARRLALRMRDSGQEYEIGGILRTPTNAELQAGYSLDQRLFLALVDDLNLLLLVGEQHPRKYDLVLDPTEGREYRIASYSYGYRTTAPTFYRALVEGGPS